MVQVQQRVLIALFLTLAWAPAGALAGSRFYPDDPIWCEPKPRNVEQANARKLNEYYDFFSHTFALDNIADLQEENHKRLPALAVNTLGEVPDSTWYENRHSRQRPMSAEELARGPGNGNAPDESAPWTVLEAKTEGITPGFSIADGKGRTYLVKLDPVTNPELASAADVIGSKFFYALGYNVPENYIVRFTRSRLRITDKSKVEDDLGRERPMKEYDLQKILSKAAKDAEGGYRGMASLIISGKPLGPFRYHGMRTDDPNDIVPHEHRRDLRGLYVFSAWLNHTDTKALNSGDFLVKNDGRSYIKHYLLDFGATLGSDSFEAKSPRAGNVYLFDAKPAAAQFFSLGLYVPQWMLTDFPNMPAVGNFETENFDPLKWRNNYPNPAFKNCLPDDGFWAAKKVMALRDEHIRTIVQTGEFSSREAAEYLVRTLAERRDKIGRAWFSRLLPLDGFEVRNGRLEFEDLAVHYGFSQPRTYSFAWSTFDNRTGKKKPLPDAPAPEVPRMNSEYLAADIHAGDPAQSVTVFVRNRDGKHEVVGIERKW
jgi:hypothetical protein